uniref:Uncharacterized protein n=1 Tax=Arundo donax TaxID=35708 RepID=A0A0A9EUZ3_ARUDO
MEDRGPQIVKVASWKFSRLTNSNPCICRWCHWHWNSHNCSWSARLDCSFCCSEKLMRYHFPDLFPYTMFFLVPIVLVNY